MPAQGRLITIEGIDGAGKSLQTRLLAENLRSNGISAVATFEPGGGADGDSIRQLLTGDAAVRWSPETEILLFTADRRNHLDTVILPAFKEGMTVVSDRFADSTRVYQGFASRQCRQLVDRLHELMIGLEPSLTFVIDIPVELALTRVRARSGGDARLEAFGSRLEELRQCFLSHASENAQRCRTVDGDRDPAEIAGDLFRETMSQLHD